MQQVTLEMRSGQLVDVHIKSLLLLSDFNQTCDVLARLSKSSSMKCHQKPFNGSRNTQADVASLFAHFCSFFPNAPNYMRWKVRC